MGSLSGKVAVVTGASRGIGKGIALALADEGATVYVTGRTVTTGSHPLPGTVGETAAEVDAPRRQRHCRPGRSCDDDQVAALFEQVEREQGRLDILVNNAIAIPAGADAAERLLGKAACRTGRWSTSACGRTLSPRGMRRESWCRRSPD